MAALIHAAGVVNPDTAFQAGPCHEVLESRMHAKAVPIYLGTPITTRTDKDVPLVLPHVPPLVDI
jgi:hypothetical protein